MKTARYVLIAALLAGCGGSDAPEDTICEKAASCTGLTEAETDECRTEAGMAPDGVLTECAECISMHTCSEIAGNACGAPCAGVNFEAEPTRQENAMTICDKAVACGEDPPPTCVADLVNGPAPDALVASCADCAETHTCTEINDGVCAAACSN